MSASKLEKKIWTLETRLRQDRGIPRSNQKSGPWVSRVLMVFTCAVYLRTLAFVGALLRVNHLPFMYWEYHNP